MAFSPINATAWSRLQPGNRSPPFIEAMNTSDLVDS
jgi:hypothetical protein